MNTAHHSKKSTDHNIRNFVHELNVFRRHVALYPPAHPKTLAGAKKILTEFNKFNHCRDGISLGITPDNLMFNGTFLEADNPSCRDLGAFFSHLDIAVISFHQGLSTTELVEFWQLLSSRVAGQQPTALDLALKEHQIFHISLKITDYSAFTQDPSGLNTAPADTDIWKEFVHSLMPLDNATATDSGNHPATQLAQLLNNSATNDPDFTAMTSKLANRLLKQCQGSVDGIGNQLYDFSKKLNPEIRQRLHEETLRTLDEQSQDASVIISNLPANFISEALLSHSNTEQQLSARLTDLLSAFAANTPAKEHQQVNPSGRIGAAQQQSRIELLLLEDQHNEYLPDNYQQTLQKILAGKIQGSLPENLAKEYRNSLAEQMIEHQCCDIIFDLLETDTDAETQDILQNNLIDLSRFFLDTGDFQALQKTLSRWMSFVNSGRSQTNLLTDKFLSSQLQRSFMEDVLLSIPVWHNGKYAELCEYLAEVGEPYTELLIERLGNEKDKELRKTWMKLLLELGNITHSTILDRLSDKRWYLVRNLLIILEQQKGKIPPKTLMNLSEHPHPEVRFEALRILFRVNPSAANRLLLTELENENPQSLKILIPLMAMSNNREVPAQLNRRLEKEPLTVENLEIKLAILAGLSSAPQSDCLLSVMRLASRREFFVNRLRKQLLSAASDTLCAYPRKQVIALLRHLDEKQRTTIQNILASRSSSTAEQSL